MSGDEELASLVARLTKAQRAALTNAPATPLGNVWLTCHGSTKRRLNALRLSSGTGDWCVLTPLGLRVRALLQGQSPC